jgi:hypothetical protein
MRRATLFFGVVLLLITAHRLPAPISEILESPTPAPEQSAKPKPKRTIKPKVTSESSESSTKRKTALPAQSQPTPNRNPFDGTWRGFLHVADYTLIINVAGNTVTEKSAKWGTFTWPTTCDGKTIRWNDGGSCAWTFTPNPDEKTALATANCPGLFGFGAGSWSSVFQRASP